MLTIDKDFQSIFVMQLVLFDARTSDLIHIRRINPYLWAQYHPASYMLVYKLHSHRGGAVMQWKFFHWVSKSSREQISERRFFNLSDSEEPCVAQRELFKQL